MMRARAFFDVEFATTGWTSLANVDWLGGDLAAARASRPTACRSGSS